MKRGMQVILATIALFVVVVYLTNWFDGNGIGETPSQKQALQEQANSQGAPQSGGQTLPGRRERSQENVAPRPVQENEMSPRFSQLEMDEETRIILADSLDHLNKNEPKKAAKLLKAKLKEKPDNPFILAELAYVSGQLLKNPTAEKKYINELYQKHPDSFMGNSAMGDLLLRDEKPREALKYLEKATQSMEHPPAGAYTQVAMAHLELDNPLEADKNFQKAINESTRREQEGMGDEESLRLETGHHLLNYARSLVEQGEFQRAQSLIQQATERFGPESAEIYDAYQHLEVVQSGGETVEPVVVE